MIKLTQKEKADRFDALQVAFEITKDHYTRCKDESEKKAERTGLIPDLISAYNKGVADTYSNILQDLERWIV